MLRMLGSVVRSLLPTPIQRWALRRAGHSVGERVKISPLAVLVSDSIDLGNDCRIGPFSLIRCQSLKLGNRARLDGLCRISGSSITLGADSRICRLVEIVGEVESKASNFSAGACSWIFPRCFIDIGEGVELGRNVGVGGSTYIFTHGLWLSGLHGYPVDKRPVTIGNNVWLPWRCFVMPGVEIGDGSIVGAQSVVNRSLPGDCLAAGVPARVLREDISAPLPTSVRVDRMRAIWSAVAERLELDVKVGESNELLALVDSAGSVVAELCLDGKESGTRGPDSPLLVGWSVPSDVSLRTGPGLRLEDFRSSPWGLFNPCCRRVLEALRLDGVRYFPIDEP